jgi:cyclic dehypoxanthinyl futalosine synthase
MAISPEQALNCLHSDDLIGIGMEADAIRRRLHPEGVVTYATVGEIHCAARTLPEILAAARHAEDCGVTGLILNGAGAATASIVAAIKASSPDLVLQALSTDELTAFASDIQASQTLFADLQAAGLDSIGSSTPELPDARWLALHRAAHHAGISTTAHIVFGAGESPAQRIAQLESIRNLQAETAGFRALAPISHHALNGRVLDETTAVEYLKTLAVARMVVDNIANLQADWSTQGLKVLQMALRFGANDAGSVRAESPGIATEEELRRIIRDAGFQPAQRDVLYRAMLLS